MQKIDGSALLGLGEAMGKLKDIGERMAQRQQESRPSFEAAMVGVLAISSISILATEYKAKTISAERFAERVCELLMEFDGAARTALSETAEGAK